MSELDVLELNREIKRERRKLFLLNFTEDLGRSIQIVTRTTFSPTQNTSLYQVVETSTVNHTISNKNPKVVQPLY